MARPALLAPALLLVCAGGCHRQAPPAPQAQAPATPEPTATGPSVDETGKGRPIPAVEVKDLAGGTAKLADLKGKPLLVNMWATWCAPCVKELPTLDRLAAFDAGKLQVVAVSQDMEGARVVQPFLQAHRLTTVKPYLDGQNALMLQLKEAGLPVTVLYGADGKELWRVRGDLDWTGAKAKALLAEAGV